jgi:hypothetical protein
VSAAEIARRHFNAALDEAKAANVSGDVIARHTLALVIATFLANRSADDVRRELLAAAENTDPDADFIFMRP